MRRWSIRRRLLVGFLTLFVVSSLGVSIAVVAVRDAERAIGGVSEQAEAGRRLAQVSGWVREFYIHQAHLALGLRVEHHVAQTRIARAELGRALDALEAIDPQETSGWLRGEVRALDSLLDDRFLPALRAGDQSRAIHVHHMAVDRVDGVTRRLDRAQAAVAEAIAGARAEASAAAETAVQRSALSLGLTALLAALVAFLTSRSITGPLARLRQAAAKLVANPVREVPTAGPAEVGALGSALNDMLAALDDQRAARSRAEALAVLGRVSAGVAHEINNPLGVILGHARLIERGLGEAEDAAAIVREASLCQEIVQAMLDYARPGALRSDSVEIHVLVDTLAERFGATYTGPTLPPVPGDAARLQQLLKNLLGNARAFGETVEVRAEVLDDAIEIEVIDDGPGVPAADVEAVFEPFRSGRPGGVGLGLAIARSIAEAHRGRLTAFAGPGGRFQVRLPR